MRNEIVLYQSDELSATLEVRIEDETVWLSLNQIAQLFDRDKSVISRHLRNIFKSGELIYDSTVAKNATVQMEAGREVKREIEFYNLDAILSVGYRVKSKQGTQFRIWATAVLKGNIIKGYTMYVERLRNPSKISAIPLIIERLNIILRIIAGKLCLEIDFVEKGKCYW